MRTVRGVILPSFKQACIALGLVEDDSEWDMCLEEASHSSMPRQLRQLFANVLIYCNPSNPSALLEKYLNYLGDDFTGNILEKVAKAVEDILIQFRMSWNSIPGLPPVTFTEASPNPVLDEVYEDMSHCVSAASPLNAGQQCAFDAIVRSLDPASDTKVFFVDGPGGTGKTFLYNKIVDQVHIFNSYELTENWRWLLLQAGLLLTFYLEVGRLIPDLKSPSRLTVVPLAPSLHNLISQQ